MGVADAAAVAETAFSTVGVKSFSRAERVERIDLAVNSLRRGIRLRIPRRTFTILARNQIIGSMRVWRMESDFLVNCSTPFLPALPS